MLIISLILSALLLAIANVMVWRFRNAGTMIGGLTLGILVSSFFLMCLLPALTVQSVLLAGAVVVWRSSRRSPSFFLPLSCGATLLAYGVSGLLVLGTEREYARLRVRYPYESMEGRLPAPKPATDGAARHPDTIERLARLEGAIGDHANGYREYQLKRLHEHAVSLFIASPGFGVSRMGGTPSESNLAMALRREPAPSQPGTRFTSLFSPGDLQRPSADDGAALGRMLDESIEDFVNFRGFGYVKDRRHVAGFQSHRFSKIPDPANSWKVRTLDLVSLLLHDEPAVYVSDRLPRMDRLRGVPTRPLDRFERFALNSLQQGEDIIMARGEEGIRMLGAVRGARQCVVCHGGDRGDLLGAFTYTLCSDGP